MRLRTDTLLHPILSVKVIEVKLLVTSKETCLDQEIMIKNRILEEVKQLLLEADLVQIEKMAYQVPANIIQNMTS